MSPLFKNGIASLLIRGVGTLLAFILSIYIAKLVGIEQFGIYSFVLSGLIILSIPVQAGLPTLAVRECAREIKKNNYDVVYGILMFGIKYLVLYLKLLLLFSFSIHCLLGDVGDKWIYLSYMVLTIPFMALILFLSGVLRGANRLILGILPDGLLRHSFQLIILITVTSLGLFSDQLNLAFFSYVVSLVLLVVFVIVSIWLLFRFNEQFNVRQSKKITDIQRTNWRTSLVTFTVVGGVHFLFTNIDLFILGLLGTDVDVAEYRVAVQFSLVVSFGLAAINQVLQPYFAQITNGSDHERLQKAAVNSSLVLIAVAIIPAVILLLWSDVVIQLTFGMEYIGAALLLNLLIMGQLFNTGVGSVGMMLNMAGHEKITVRVLLVAVAINISLDIWLIPIYGSMGAAISSLITVVFWNLVLRKFVLRIMGVESSGLLYILKNKRLL